MASGTASKAVEALPGATTASCLLSGLHPGVSLAAGHYRGAVPATPLPDLDLRVVRYFVAVAERQHLGRAALELGITQPALSRQMRRFEEQLGAALLERSAAGTTLTPAGEAFLPDARGLLAAAHAAAAKVEAAAMVDRIRVGYTTNIIITPAVRELRLHHPEAEVETLHLAWDEPLTALLEHEVDAVVTRLPLAADHLDVTVLYDEPRVLLVAHDHRLAGSSSVSVADIAHDAMPRVSDQAWNAFWRIDPRPDGTPAPGGPLVRALEDKLELIAGGQAVAIIATEEHDSALRPDLVTIPLTDAAPSQVVLATRPGEQRPLVLAFSRSARALLIGPPPPPSSPAAPGTASMKVRERSWPRPWTPPD